MPEYTPEQIEQAKEWMRYQIKWHKPGSSPAIHYPVILAALEAAEQERDEWRESSRTANTALLKVCKERDALAAYAAKLENAGDAMRRSTWIDFRAASFAWDVARKEKPRA